MPSVADAVAWNLTVRVPPGQSSLASPPGQVRLMRELTASQVGVQVADEQVPAAVVVPLRLNGSTANALETPIVA